MLYGQERRQPTFKNIRRQQCRDFHKRFDFMQSVIDSVSDPIMVLGTDMKVKLTNVTAQPASPEGGCQASDYCYKVLFGLDTSCSLHGRDCPLFRVMETGEPVVVEHDMAVDDGELKSYEILASPLLDQDGTMLGIIESLRDITERKRITNLLQQNHDQLERRIAERTRELEAINQTLRQEIAERRWAEHELMKAVMQADRVFQVIPSATFTVDRDRTITSWNNKAEQVTGYSRPEVMGKSCSLFALEPCLHNCGIYDEDNGTPPIIGKECKIRTKSGEIRIISKNADLLSNPEGEVIGAVESFEDITEQKEFERQLRTERDKLKAMLAAMDEGMHIVNADYEIEYQNQVLLSHFGDRLGHKCYSVYKNQQQPCENCRMHHAIEQGETQRAEVLMKDGCVYEQSYAPFTDIDGKTKALILLRDITEERAHQAETMRAGQLASIGELAASVAHEINNPINGIINYAQILMDGLGEGSDSAEAMLLAKLIGEGDRIAAITGNLLSFARQQDETCQQVSVAEVMDNALALVHHQFLKDGIKVVVEMPADLPQLELNGQKLQQVFLNLLSNARHALNSRYPKRHEKKQIEITTSLVNGTGSSCSCRTTVTDYGHGVPLDIQEHIFEPFFTSKKPGEGTGLGLSISHKIIDEFGGTLWLDSEPDSHTCMGVDLPLN